jgi:hypothetical protein
MAAGEKLLALYSVDDSPTEQRLFEVWRSELRAPQASATPLPGIDGASRRPRS